MTKKAADYRNRFRQTVRDRPASRVRNEGFAGDYEVGMILAKINLLPRLRVHQAHTLIEAIVKKTEPSHDQT